jgi:hypothetical protein
MIEVPKRGEFTDRSFIHENQCKPPVVLMNKVVPAMAAKQFVACRTESWTNSGDFRQWGPSSPLYLQHQTIYVI